MLRLSFLKHFRMSSKLVTSGPFRGLALRHAGTFLAGFGRLFQSTLEGRARAPGSYFFRATGWRGKSEKTKQAWPQFVLEKGTNKSKANSARRMTSSQNELRCKKYRRACLPVRPVLSKKTGKNMHFPPGNQVTSLRTSTRTTVLPWVFTRILRRRSVGTRTSSCTDS